MGDVLCRQPEHHVERLEEVEEDRVYCCGEVRRLPYVDEVGLLEDPVPDPSVLVGDDGGEGLCQPLGVEDDVVAQGSVLLEAYERARHVEELRCLGEVSFCVDIAAARRHLPVLTREDRGYAVPHGDLVLEHKVLVRDSLLC